MAGCKEATRILEDMFRRGEIVGYGEVDGCKKLLVFVVRGSRPRRLAELERLAEVEVVELSGTPRALEKEG